MSRCFPFPPPGYEKKIRTNEADLLTKEKRKDKKHKKDKKDREKKEGKEKKDKERSKEKHKERKEKKEKHKDRKDKDRDKEKSRTLEQKKPEVPPETRDREKLETNILQNNSNGDSRFVQDLARRISDGEEATGSRNEQKTKVADKRNAGLTGRGVENNSRYLFQETNHRRDDDKRINSQRNFAVAKSSENAFPREYFGTDQKRVEGTGKPTEKKDVGKQMDGKEKTQRMESAIKSDKLRDKEGVKKSETKAKERHKEKKEEKMEVINKASQEKPKFIEGWPGLKERDKDSLDTRNGKPPDISRASNKNLAVEGNLGKRKDLEMNGFLYENGSRPNKLQRPVASPLSAMENGRKLGATQTPPKSVSELQGMVCKPDIKEHRINGFINSQEPKALPLSSVAATVKAQIKENVEGSVKPPHPDLKYLSQMLSIPQRDLPEFDDQEWLFSDSRMRSQKPRTDSPVLDETLQVWDQAFRIESADIAALPYVVPY